MGLALSRGGRGLRRDPLSYGDAYRFCRGNFFLREVER